MLRLDKSGKQIQHQFLGKPSTLFMLRNECAGQIAAYFSKIGLILCTSANPMIF